MSELKSCPFCRTSAALSLQKHPTDNWGVWCEHCNAWGPGSVSLQMARISWNVNAGQDPSDPLTYTIRHNPDRPSWLPRWDLCRGGVLIDSYRTAEEAAKAIHDPENKASDSTLRDPFVDPRTGDEVEIKSTSYKIGFVEPCSIVVLYERFNRHEMSLEEWRKFSGEGKVLRRRDDG